MLGQLTAHKHTLPTDKASPEPGWRTGSAGLPSGQPQAPALAQARLPSPRAGLPPALVPLPRAGQLPVLGADRLPPPHRGAVPAGQPAQAGRGRASRLLLPGAGGTGRAATQLLRHTRSPRLCPRRMPLRVRRPVEMPVKCRKAGIPDGKGHRSPALRFKFLPPDLWYHAGGRVLESEYIYSTRTATIDTEKSRGSSDGPGG